MSVVPPQTPERHLQRVAAFNQLVRAFITLSFSAAFVWGFLVAHTISGEVFTNLVVLAVTFWFSQATQQRRTAQPPNGVNGVNGPPPPPASAPEPGRPPRP